MDRDTNEYKEWEYKAKSSEDTSQFAGNVLLAPNLLSIESIETIFNIKDIKFRSTEIDLPDPSCKTF
jgi:hypothetical protein